MVTEEFTLVKQKTRFRIYRYTLLNDSTHTTIDAVELPKLQASQDY